MPIRIAPLTDVEEAEWLAMRHALWPHATPEEHARDKVTMTAEDALVLIARDDSDRAVGFAELCTRAHANGCESSPVAYLEGIWIDDSRRGQGIGQQLIAAAENWARERGLVEMASDALVDNHGSIAAHKSWGFNEIMQVSCFRKTLTAGAMKGAA